MSDEIYEIEITRAGIGNQDGCWIWHDGALYQIHPCESPSGKIHGMRLECRKGDWQFVVLPVQSDKALWKTLAARLLAKIQPCQEVA